MPDKTALDRDAQAPPRFLSGARTSRSLGLVRHGGGGGVNWRLVLLALSASGSIASIVCLVGGHPGLAARVFAAVVIVLVGLVLT